jgi:DNA gyrase subunit A
MEADAIEEEYAGSLAEIDRSVTISGDEEELLGVIREELVALKDEYGDERRTEIIEDVGVRKREDLIPEEDTIIVVTADDYVKRMSVEQFSPQRRGGKGIIGADPKDSDRVSQLFQASTHDDLLCFTNYGQVYRVKVYDIPEMSRTARGTSAVNVLDLDDGEEIAAVVTTDDFEAGEFLTMVTRRGFVKRTRVENFENILSTGIIATRLEADDELVDVVMTDGTQDVIISSRQGRAIRFHEEEVRAMGRSARGVHGIELDEGNSVAGMDAITAETDEWLLTVTERGYGKRTSLHEYRVQSRNGKGLIDIKTPARNGEVCSIATVGAGEHLLAMTETGQIMRTPVEEISVVGRNTMGVIVIDVASDDSRASIDVIAGEVGNAE